MFNKHVNKPFFSFLFFCFLSLVFRFMYCRGPHAPPALLVPYIPGRGGLEIGVLWVILCHLWAREGPLLRLLACLPVSLIVTVLGDLH